MTSPFDIHDETEQVFENVERQVSVSKTIASLLLIGFILSQIYSALLSLMSSVSRAARTTDWESVGIVAGGFALCLVILFALFVHFTTLRTPKEKPGVLWRFFLKIEIRREIKRSGGNESPGSFVKEYSLLLEKETQKHD